MPHGTVAARRCEILRKTQRLRTTQSARRAMQRLLTKAAG
jgi:hypothetical protein